MATRPLAQLTWFTRDGRKVGTIRSPSPLHNPTISPDGRYVAADDSGSNMSIWLVDLARGTPTRVADGVLPVWGPRGSDIVFTSRRVGGSSDLVHRSIVGASTDESLLLRTPHMKIGGNWTDDNRYIVYTGSDPRTKLDLWTLTVADRTPIPFLRTPFNEMHGQVSPDGRWLAYASDESGTWEVYVQTFPVPGAKRTISVGGGAEPQWRRDGRELYYLAPDGTLMAVPVSSTRRNLRRRPRRPAVPGTHSGGHHHLPESLRAVSRRPAVPRRCRRRQRADQCRRELDRTITSALSIGATLSPRRLLSFVHRTAVAITGIHTEYAEHSVRCFRLGGGSLNLRPFKIRDATTPMNSEI